VNQISRRAFVKSAVFSAAALGAAPILAESPRRKIKVGFLGGAHSHGLAKWKIINASPDFELLGIAEESAQVRSQYQKLGAKLRSRDELLDTAELIIIESAVRDHARDAKIALNAGKHLHVEKPPTVRMNELTELVELARKNKRTLQVGYMWRYHPGFAAMFEAVRTGWLGEIYLVRGMINTSVAPERRAEWAEFKGGGMFELGCHLIDPIVRLLGRPLRVRPTLRRDAAVNDNLKDNGAVVFEFEHAMGVITNTTLQPDAFAYRSFEVLGSNGTAVLKPIEPPTFQIDLAKAAGSYKSGFQTIKLPAYERYIGDFVELAAAIRGEKPISVTLDEELLVHEALLKACEME
jgi:predicted dehydrogenase